MSHMPPQQALRGLPIGETFSTAYKSLFDNLRHFPKAVTLPFLVSLALAVAYSSIEFTRTDPSSQDALSAMGIGFSWESLIFQVLNFIPYAIFATTWHRLVLFGADREPPSFLVSWQPRHTRMFLTLLLMDVIFNLPFYGISAIWSSDAEPYFAAVMAGTPIEQIDPAAAAAALSMTGIMLLWMCVYFYFLMRVCFVFPAIAAEESYGFGDSWRHTKGQGLRLVVTAIVISIPIGIVNLMVILMFGNFLFNLLIAYLLVALWTSLFSTAFRHCTGWIPDAPTTPSVVDARRDEADDG